MVILLWYIPRLPYCAAKQKGNHDMKNLMRLFAIILILMLSIPALCMAEGETTNVAALAEGADVRIMSYNILHPDWNDRIPIKNRDQRFLNIIQHYMPDVVGIQEAGAKWQRFWIKNLVDTGVYAPACQQSHAEGFSFCTTTFLYNPNTVKLIDEYILDLIPNHVTRVVSVGVFETIADGARFVVTNVHTAPSNAPEEYAAHFATLIDYCEEDMAKYAGLPYIMVGDYNTDEAFEMYQNFMTATNVKDAKYEADVLVNDHATYIGWGDEELTPGRDYCVDHIFVNDKTDVKYFEVVLDLEADQASDHLPIYADIDLQ